MSKATFTDDEWNDQANPARRSNRCYGCDKAKGQGGVLCWGCFKGGKVPFKYFDGDLVDWLNVMGRYSDAERLHAVMCRQYRREPVTVEPYTSVSYGDGPSDADPGL